MKNKIIYGLLLVFTVVFVIIVLKGLTTAQPGDENVYYYMGKLITYGKVPYKDFFFAHPPLHIYLIALIYKIFGFNILILKLIPLISILISAFFIFKIAKEKFGNIEAVLSFLLFLFSYGVIFNSVFSFGIDVATMFLVVGIYFLLSKKSFYVLSGIFFGLAGVTRLLSLVPIFIFLIATLFSSRKNFIKLSFAFLAIFLLFNGYFILLDGNSYLTSVYKFHLLKTLGGKENFKEYIDIIKLNWILFSSALLAIFVKGKKRINLFVAVSIVYLIFLLGLKKIFGFYFITVFPFLAITGGYSIANIFRQFNLSRKWKIFVSIVFLLIFAWNLTADIFFLEKVGFTGFKRGKDMVNFVNSVSSENTLLFGDDSIVPLLALLTNKRIALDFVDTNNEVFISGVKNLSNVLADLKEKDILFVIRSKQGISYFKEVRDFLRNCKFLSQFHDEIEGDYLFYRCS